MIFNKPPVLPDEELERIYPPPGSDKYPEWDICDDCPYPFMAREAQRDADFMDMAKQFCKKLAGYKQLAGKRIYVTAEHPDEWVELEEDELSVVIIMPIDDWQALQKAGEK